MEFITEHNSIAFIVIFLLVLVLAMQIQLNIISKRIEEKEEHISGKIEELLKKKISQLLSKR
jgi:F0F1-type ATP synthase membrane subunit b/b'